MNLTKAIKLSSTCVRSYMSGSGQSIDLKDKDVLDTRRRAVNRAYLAIQYTKNSDQFEYWSSQNQTIYSLTDLLLV